MFARTQELPDKQSFCLFGLRATNDNHDLGYQLFYWRTRDQHEVDFVLYGERGLWTFEVQRFRACDHSHA